MPSEWQKHKARQKAKQGGKMKRLYTIAAFVLALVALVLFGVSKCNAQTNEVPTFSHGPTASVYSIRFEETVAGEYDAKFGMLTEGIGYSFNLNNVVGSADGSMSWLGFKFPVYPRVFDSEFALAMGAEIGLFNNLLGFGAAVDMVNTQTDRGAFIGKVQGDDVMITVSLGFNLGSGSTPPALKGMDGPGASSAAYYAKPPFNFVSLKR